MDKLWAPWRVKYVRELIGKTKGCVFCRMLKEKKDKRNLIFVRTKLSFAVLNLYPYNNGHLMIAPRRHLASPELLDRAERAALAELQAAAVERLRRALKCDGLNLGVNLGRSAGAGFADHMHWHVVPRWEGDVNFMPVIAGTRVLSQHLEETFDLLSPLFKTVGAAIS